MGERKPQHPFAGRKGSKRRDEFAVTLFARQSGTCNMCHAALPADLRGKRSKRSPVVDHLKPWRLRPDLSYVIGNLQLICRACHAICHSIEETNPGNADLIAEIKARQGEDW